jgi:hypothetical protein
VGVRSVAVMTQARTGSYILDRTQTDMINAQSPPPSPTPVHVYDQHGNLIGEYASFADAIAACERTGSSADPAP